MRVKYSINILFLILIVYGLLPDVYAFSESDSNEHKYYATLAKQYLKEYKYDTAALYYDSAIHAVEKNENLTAYFILKLGTTFRKARLYDSAFRYLQKARKLAIKNENDSVQALSEIELGWAYTSKGSLDSAEYHYNHALSIYESLSDSLGIGLALHNLSDFYQKNIDHKKSLKYALESNRIFRNAKNDNLYCRSLLNLGNVYDIIGEFDTAFACYSECYTLSLKLNNLRLAGKAAYNKGYMYLYWKHYDEAEAAFLNAIDFCVKIKDFKDLSLLYRNLSIVQKKLDKWDEALKNANKSLLYARKIDNKEMEFWALVNMGVYYKDQKNYALTETFYMDAAKKAEKYDFKSGKQKIYGNLSRLFKTTKNFEKAYEYLVKSVAISDSILDIEKAKALEKYKAEYELLHYKDQNRIKELEKKKIRFERNLSYGIGATLVVLLMVILFFFRMRAQKNKIIAAQKIQKLEDEKKLMAAQSVLVGQEKERERIARELHDGIGVLLSTASIHFSSVEAKADEETGKMLKKANKLLKEAGKEVRQISHDMMPGVLSKFGLKEAIEDLFEDVEEVGEIEIDLDIVCPNDQRLPENMEIMIYRIVQEMLNNTLKYAKASNIVFNIARGEKEIRIEYKDNGIGFDEAKLPLGKNLGLSGLHSRVDYLSGKIKMDSKPGKGVKYLIIIPLI